MEKFSVYTNTTEQIQQAKRRKQREKKYRILLCGMLVIFCFLGLFFYQNPKFDEIKTVKTISESQSLHKNLVSYQEGVIQYAEDRVTYYDQNGKKKWSESCQAKNPELKVAGNYVLVIDKQERKLVVFNKKGHKTQIVMTYIILDAEISETGIIAVSLEAGNARYIEMYTLKGDCISSIKTTIDETGYPLDITLSPDGKNLCASYFVVDGVESKNRIVFYDFSKEGDKVQNVLGWEDYDNTIMPTMVFLDKNTVASIGDDRMLIYYVGNTIKLKKEVKIESAIKSIAYDQNYIAIVRNHVKNEKDGNYTLEIFSRNGNKIGLCGIDEEYTNIEICRKQIILSNAYHVMIVTKGGHEILRSTFHKRLFQMLPSNHKYHYFAVYRNATELVKLK